jgi:histone H3/H4
MLQESTVQEIKDQVSLEEDCEKLIKQKKLNPNYAVITELIKAKKILLLIGKKKKGKIQFEANTDIFDTNLLQSGITFNLKSESNIAYKMGPKTDKNLTPLFQATKFSSIIDVTNGRNKFSQILSKIFSKKGDLSNAENKLLYYLLKDIKEKQKPKKSIKFKARKMDFIDVFLQSESQIKKNPISGFEELIPPPIPKTIKKQLENPNNIIDNLYKKKIISKSDLSFLKNSTDAYFKSTRFENIPVKKTKHVPSKKRFIPWTPLRGLMKKTGGSIVSREAVETLLYFLEVRAKFLTEAALKFAKHSKRKKISESDMELAREYL